MTSPAPGWYPDPADVNSERYWDGSKWTNSVRVPTTPLFSPPKVNFGTTNADASPVFLEAIQTTNTQKPRRLRKILFAGILVLIPLFILAGISAPKTSVDSSTTEISSAEAETTTTLEGLKTDIGARLGSLNREGDRIRDISLSDGELTVNYALNDNFSNKLIITGAWRDTGNILAAVQNSSLRITSVVSLGTLPLQDKYGNSVGEGGIISVVFDEAAIKSVNLENLPGEMLESAASEVNIRKGFLS